MKTLLIMRHAKSSWKRRGLADHDRPLNGRGKRDAPRMGRWLKEQGIRPDCILSSSAKRASKTAAAVADALECVEAVQVSSDLYAAGPDDYLRLLRALPDDVETAMIVAHDPALSHFVSMYAGDYTAMPTAAIACFDVPIEHWDTFAPGTQCTLRAHWMPKALPDEA